MSHGWHRHHRLNVHVNTTTTTRRFSQVGSSVELFGETQRLSRANAAPRGGEVSASSALGTVADASGHGAGSGSSSQCAEDCDGGATRRSGPVLVPLLASAALLQSHHASRSVVHCLSTASKVLLLGNWLLSGWLAENTSDGNCAHFSGITTGSLPVWAFVRAKSDTVPHCEGPRENRGGPDPIQEPQSVHIRSSW